MELLPKLSRKPSKTVFHLEKCPGDYFTDTRLCSNKSCPDISGSKGEYPVDPISERLQTTATYFAFTASVQRDFHAYIKTAVGRFLGSEEGGPSIKNVGFYFIGKTIGEGTFGKVKRGIHKISGCEVAVKIYSKTNSSDPYVTMSMQREAKLMQKLRHSNIIQLYEVVETENNYYLVLEYCSNGSLLDLVERKRKIEVSEAREYFRQIVSAVDYLHSQTPCIIHRDIKLENLLLTGQLIVKLIDFGLSNTPDGQTQCGSPLYASPEMLGAKSYGKEVDIWSIGVCLFIMLMGYAPFQPANGSGPGALTILHAQMLDGRMHRIRDDLSQNCRSLLTDMLKCDPVKRITLKQIISHPWVTCKGLNPLLQTTVFSDLGKEDLNEAVLGYMESFVEVLHIESHEELVKSITNNRQTSVAASYYMLNNQYELFAKQRTISRSSMPRMTKSEPDLGKLAASSNCNCDTLPPLCEPFLSKNKSKPRYVKQKTEDVDPEGENFTRKCERQRHISLPGNISQERKQRIKEKRRMKVRPEQPLPSRQSKMPLRGRPETHQGNVRIGHLPAVSEDGGLQYTKELFQKCKIEEAKGKPQMLGLLSNVSHPQVVSEYPDKNTAVLQVSTKKGNRYLPSSMSLQSITSESDDWK